MEVSQGASEETRMRHKVDNGGMILWVKGDADADITLLSHNWSMIATLTLGAYCEGQSSSENLLPKVNASIFQILSASEFKLIWISWVDAVLRLGSIQEKSVITVLKNKKLRDVSYVQLSDNVQWKIESRPPYPVPSIQYFEGGEEHWVPYKGKIPEDAFIGGHLEDGDFGEPLFVVRAKFNGSLTPGYCKLSELKAVIPWGGGVRVIDDFEILCGYNFEWIKMHGSRIPPDAVIGGYSEVQFEQLFIIRAHYDGQLIVGKAHRRHELAYIPWEDRELELANDFEVLVSRSSRLFCRGDRPSHVAPHGSIGSFDDNELYYAEDSSSEDNSSEN